MEKHFMQEALKLAKQAYDNDEIPIGAVIVKDDKIIGRGYNKREKEQKVISHAEINAIKEANEYLNSWRLDDCEMYVTMEPCMMCTGAIIQSRIKKVFYGAKRMKESEGPSFSSIIFEKKYHLKEVKQVLDGECAKLIQSFFQGLRRN